MEGLKEIKKKVDVVPYLKVLNLGPNNRDLKFSPNDQAYRILEIS
jgi:hypothetical protein